MTTANDPTWDDLAGRFGQKAVLSTPLRIRDEMGQTVLACDKRKAVPGAVILGLLGSVFVAIGLFALRRGAHGWSIFDPDFGGGFAIVGMLVFLLGTALGVSILRSSRQLRVSSQPGRIEFDGRGLDGLSLPSSGIEARLEAGAQPDVSSAPRLGTIIKTIRSANGRYRLELVRQASPDSPILLATSSTRTQLVPTFEALTKLLGAGEDDTVERIEVPGGQTVAVPPEALGGTSVSNMRTARLTVCSDDLVEIRPTMGLKLFFGVFLLIGVACAAGSIPVFAGEKAPGFVLLGFGAVFGTVGGLGVSGVFGPKPVVFDLARGVVTKMGGKMPVPELAEGLPLDRLCALQVCSYWVSGDSESAGYTMYELNAVLREPPGKRFTIMTDCKRDRLMPQTEQLRELLNLPLIDQAAGR